MGMEVKSCRLFRTSVVFEFSDNPLGYKFPWSSRGVLLALKNAARYWEGGNIVEGSDG
jgi:saccharopine dehydrogenase-like NADP-dependent oxidoreductase